MAIRKARETDLEAILDIYNDAVLHTTATFDVTPRTLEAQQAWFAEHGPTYPVVVWEEEGRVLGWGSLSPYHTRCAYRFTSELSVYVAREARQRGVGEALLRELVTLGEQAGLHTLLGFVTAENTASRRLAEKVGMRQVGLLEEVGYKFERWLDVAIYQYRCGSRGGSASGGP